VREERFDSARGAGAKTPTQENGFAFRPNVTPPGVFAAAKVFSHVPVVLLN